MLAAARRLADQIVRERHARRIAAEIVANRKPPPAPEPPAPAANAEPVPPPPINVTLNPTIVVESLALPAGAVFHLSGAVLQVASLQQTVNADVLVGDTRVEVKPIIQVNPPAQPPPRVEVNLAPTLEATLRLPERPTLPAREVRITDPEGREYTGTLAESPPCERQGG